jgi:hypothetical protein
MHRNGMVAAATAVLPALLLLALPARADDDPEAKALVQKAVDNLPKVPFKAKLKLTPPQGKPRVIELSHKMVGGARASYLEVVEPEELQGIRFLFLEKPGGEPEQYMKIAASPNAVRVSGQIRKNPFLESTFYVSDLVEPDINDFTYEFVGETGIGGRKVKLVRATPKHPQEEIYGPTVIAIDPQDLIILRREFSDKQGKPFKVWSVDVVEKVEDIQTIRDQTMKNVPENASSRLQTEEIDYNVELSDAVFAPDHLKR